MASGSGFSGVYQQWLAATMGIASTPSSAAAKSCDEDVPCAGGESPSGSVATDRLGAEAESGLSALTGEASSASEFP